MRSNKLRRGFLNAKAVPVAAVRLTSSEMPIYTIAERVEAEKQRLIEFFIQFFAFSSEILENFTDRKRVKGAKNRENLSRLLVSYH